MRILIIGGTKLTGPFIVQRLMQLGHEVIVFHRGETEANLPTGVQHVHGDRMRIGEHVKEFHRLAPEVVLDMMPLAEDDTRAVVQTFTGVARRIVGISSEDVYRAYGVLWGHDSGPLQAVPLAEDAELRTNLFQDAPNVEKILAERTLLSEPRLPGTVLRYPMVYGPNDGGRIADPLRRMNDGRPAILLDESQASWRWSRGYAENVAQATVLAVLDDRAAGRIYNVAEPDVLTMTEWIQAIGDVAGWNGQVIPVPADQLPEHLRDTFNWSQDWVVDTSRIRSELGYKESISREEALRRMVDWWRQAPDDAIYAPFEPRTSPENYAAEDAVLSRRAG
jgi:nucleoside-diphosphate-sugar epimerase